MPEPLKIRTAAKEDVQDLVNLLQILFSIEEDFNVDTDKQKRGLEMMLENPETCVMVAESAGKAVGMCTGQLTISTAEGGPSALIEDMVVDPGHRGKGIGAKLLEHIHAWARDNKAARLQLLADRNNTPALEFYKHLGWDTTQLICLRKRLDCEE